MAPYAYFEGSARQKNAIFCLKSVEKCPKSIVIGCFFCGEKMRSKQGLHSAMRAQKNDLVDLQKDDKILYLILYF